MIQKKYRKASDTFQDATKLMHQLLMLPMLEVVHPSGKTKQIQNTLQNATSRIAQASFQKVINNTNDGISISVLSDNAFVLLEKAKHMTDGPSTMNNRLCIFPIRIDDVSIDINNPATLDDYDFKASVLLYNFGLAMLCRARTTLDMRENLFYTRSAWRVLNNAYAALRQRSDDSDDEFSIRQIAIVDISLHAAMLSCAPSRQLADAITDELRTLITIVSGIDHCLDSIHCGNQIFAAPSA